MRLVFPGACLALLALFFAGCTEAQKPGYLAIASGPRPLGASEINMIVATTRAPDEAAPGVLFAEVRGNALAFADITISVPPEPAHVFGDVRWPKDPSRPDLAIEFGAVRAEVVSMPEALKSLNARLSKSPAGEAFVFVHGYDASFGETVYRFAQIAHDAKLTATPILFAWPSRGSPYSYDYDRDSATYSRDALEAMLAALARDNAVRQISILSHAMGNWVTLEALRQMSIRNRGLPDKIKNVMLAAPDVDFDVFRRQIAVTGAQPGLFTIFLSRDDKGLATARTFGGGASLRRIDPLQEPYRDVLETSGVAVVDLSGVQAADPLGHTKFAEAPNSVRSIGAFLATGGVLTGSVQEAFMALRLGSALRLIGDGFVAFWHWIKDNMAVLTPLVGGLWAVFIYFRKDRKALAEKPAKGDAGEEGA